MQESITKNKLAYSVEEVSRQTSLSKSYLRNEIRDGNLKASKFGRRVLVLPDALQDYLNNKEKK